MKKLATFAIVCAAVAFLGTALTDAASDETPASNQASQQPLKPCCLAKTVKTGDDVAETAKLECCNQDQARAAVLAKAEACKGKSCQSDEKGTVACKLCANDAVTKGDDAAVVVKSKVARVQECREGKCNRSAASERQCQNGDAGKCCINADSDDATVLASATDTQRCRACPDQACKGEGGQCGATKFTTSIAKSGGQKCAFCKEEDCKQECSSCAEARKESAAAEDDATVTSAPRGGMGLGRAMRHGRAGDSQHEKDHDDFFFLIEHRDSIRRTVKNLPNGIETLTESDSADVADMIQTHVEAMYDRMENANPIRMRDPLFREIFANVEKIKMEVEHTDHGVRVKETSDDAYVVKLLQEHAKVVSLFIKNGFSELPKNHAAPKR